ncbi:Protein F37C4.5 [Cytospora mali]|uniref:Protein F37C4.5 n=1 Tax=Cytospora mali TaxID=578113 RepID=A0A194V0Q5_CYTMA|nr:Protein F37C4.5 [Valsa mali var. pyri (nom. inval.)]
METVQKQEYHVRDLSTRSITVFPTRAQIVRDVKNVSLKPGVNQISIIGFTPTVDEHSIKVEGTGSAVITDISVELLKNQDIFHEIYPDSDDDDSENSDDEDVPPRLFPSLSDDEKPSPSRAKEDLKEVRKKLQAHTDELKRATEVVSSAEVRLKMLDGYGDKFEPKSGNEMVDLVQGYKIQRNRIFQDHMDGTLRQRELNDQISGLQRTEKKLVKQVQKETQASLKILRKERQAMLRQLELKNSRKVKKYAEKTRIRHERERFWPRSCFVVRITLDATQYTPVSSRRSSISSVTDLVKPTENQESSLIDPEAAIQTCDLSVTYVTSAAFWSASYDLQLSTTSNTATLFFDAKLTNNTSESWKDCKIILSTSQAVFSGLQDAIPKLIPWRIKLVGKSAAASGDIVSSTQEAWEQNKWKAAWNSGSNGNSGKDLIGICFAMGVPSGTQGPSLFGEKKTTGSAQTGSLFGSASQTNAPPTNPFAQTTTENAPKTSLFGSASRNDAPPPPPQRTGGGLFGMVPAHGMEHFPGPNVSNGSNQKVKPSFGQFGASSDAGNVFSDGHHDATTLLEPEPESKPELSFEESAMEETGFTTAYDLPGTRSLIPSSTATKQRVAQISFTNVAFSHTVVAKYRPAAFLKAKLLNASRISLLKGPVGLTLDGAFMGRSTLPRCSSGDSFTMSLGVDPAIKVVYPKPEVKRGTSGVFTKENSMAYTRSVTITNTRGSSSSAGGKAVRLLVLDQVPVSEDEKLRVEIVQPRGLVEDEAGVGTGVQDGSAKDGKDWGKAVATLKKGGEVNWDVELNAGKSVRLGLEYDVYLPVGDHAVQADQTKGHFQ